MSWDGAGGSRHLPFALCVFSFYGLVPLFSSSYQLPRLAGGSYWELQLSNAWTLTSAGDGGRQRSEALFNEQWLFTQMVTQGSHLEPVDTKGRHPHLTAGNSVLTPPPPGALASTFEATQPEESPPAARRNQGPVKRLKHNPSQWPFCEGPDPLLELPALRLAEESTVECQEPVLFALPYCDPKAGNMQNPAIASTHQVSPHCPAQLLPCKLLIRLSSELALTLHLSRISISTWVKACLLDSSPYDLRSISPFCTSVSSSRKQS